jgi:hypothetical protein
MGQECQDHISEYELRLPCSMNQTIVEWIIQCACPCTNASIFLDIWQLQEFIIQEVCETCMGISACAWGNLWVCTWSIYYWVV